MWQFDRYMMSIWWNKTSTFPIRDYDLPSHRVLARFTVTNMELSLVWTGPLIQSESSWLPHHKLAINAPVGTFPDQSVVLYAEYDC